VREHPTQVFLHNPKALRIEVRVDDEELILWWSPKAGESYDARDRNFSNRDEHLPVFDRIGLRGLGLDRFRSCDYDPYHAVLRFEGQTLHVATTPDAPVALLWCEAPQRIDFKTGRYDENLAREPRQFVIRRREPSYAFRFAAVLGPGAGAFRHSPLVEPWCRTYAMAELAAGQALAIGVGLEGDDVAARAQALADAPVTETLKAVDRALAPHEAAGAWTAPGREALPALRRLTVRSLHSAIDDSGALRAALKPIYYLIWVRDGGFCFGYQAAAGWTHRLGDWCRLLLANPTEADAPGVPPGKMFAQLVNRRFGKFEEDGIYYAAWSAFTHWTQTGREEFVTGANRQVLRDAMDWVERYIFDADRGLFGEFFADESPVRRSRDAGWDAAIGQPTGDVRGLEAGGGQIARLYDLYINLLLHAAWTMLAAFPDEPGAEAYADKARRLWTQMAPFFDACANGLPPYGEALLEDGRRARVDPFGPARSVYVWAFCLPTFAPIPGIDGLRRRLLEDLMRNPAGHWINGLCAVIASLDTWVCPETILIDAIDRIGAQAMKSGRYLPMAGTIPEKFDAPEGNLYHDIRPQAFAQSSWLAACANLGVRRLPFGLAVRPTRVLASLRDYQWRGRAVSFSFPKVDGRPVLVINGRPVPHTLQVPEAALADGANEVTLLGGGRHPCLLRSTVRLESVAVKGGDVTYALTAFGPAELVFAEEPRGAAARDGSGRELPLAHSAADGLHFVRFEARGEATFRCRAG